MNPKTPRTDAAVGWGVGGMEVVTSGFARTLEKELNEARAEAENIRDYLCETWEPIPMLLPWEKDEL